jgi:hypothetical protein
LGSLHSCLAPLQRSSSSPSSLPSNRHVRGSSCGTASHSGSPRSLVHRVVRCLAPCRCSSSSLSPCLLSRLLCTFFKESVALIHSIRRMGRLNVYFASFDFYQSHLTILLVQKNLWKCRNNYDILKIFIMIKHVIVK